jgi:hypothetical protein
MLEISNELHNALEKVALDKYINDKILQFSYLYPDFYYYKNKNDIGDLVKAAIQKGKKNKMTSDREINELLLFMVYFGWEFEHDPRYPWAALNTDADAQKDSSKKKVDSQVRLMKIHDQFDDLYAQVSGVDHCHEIAALEAYIQVTFQDFHRRLDSTEDILTFFETIYPQYFRIISISAIEEIIENAFSQAKKYCLIVKPGAALFSWLMIRKGIAFYSDPLCRRIIDDIIKVHSSGLEREQILFHSIRKDEKERLSFLLKRNAGRRVA